MGWTHVFQSWHHVVHRPHSVLDPSSLIHVCCKSKKCWKTLLWKVFIETSFLSHRHVPLSMRQGLSTWPILPSIDFYILYWQLPFSMWWVLCLGDMVLFQHNCLWVLTTLPYFDVTWCFGESLFTSYRPLCVMSIESLLSVMDVWSGWHGFCFSVTLLGFGQHAFIRSYKVHFF